MSKNAWIFIADRESWLECAKIGSFGLEKAPGRLKEAQPEDPIIAYIRGESIFAGLGKLTSPYYHDTKQVWEDGLYPHRINISVNLDFSSAIDVRSLIDRLDFIKDKPHWSVFFRGGVAKIPYSDFETIKASIERQNLKTKVREEPLIGIEGKKDITQLILSVPELSTSSLHDRLAEMIHVVGLRMGYDSVQKYKTRPDSPYQIDVAWLQNKNPQIAIEIHYSGILGDALNRLRHARDFNFRKVVLVIVEPDDHKRALDILKFDERLKHVIDLWSVKSIYDMYTSCVSFYQLYSKFEQSAYKEETDKELR
jgi:hypothetical protein